VDGFQTGVLQALGGRAGRGRHTTQSETPENGEGSRSHDSILNLPDFYMP
jgi:hypothetical protein